MTRELSDQSTAADLLATLEAGTPSYEESAGRADQFGAEVANAYMAGYWRALEVCRAALDQEARHA